MKKKPIQVPYHKTFKLLKPLEKVRCWNFVSNDTFTVQAGLLITLNHPNDATSTTVCVVDKDGKAPGILLNYVPHGRTEPVQQLGYRFTVNNLVLGDAIGIPMPERTYDLVGDILAYETGKATDRQTKRLFTHLRKTGLGKQLQGHYSSRM